MDHEAFEQKLKQLPLRKVSPELFEHIEKELSRDTPHSGSAEQRNVRLKRFAGAAAAIVILGAGIFLWTYFAGTGPDTGNLPDPDPAQASAQHAEVHTGDVSPPLPAEGILRTERVRERFRDCGTHMLDPDTPVRTFEKTVIRQIEWRTPQTDVILQMDIPTRDVILVSLPCY